MIQPRAASTLSATPDFPATPGDPIAEFSGSQGLLYASRNGPLTAGRLECRVTGEQRYFSGLSHGVVNVRFPIGFSIEETALLWLGSPWETPNRGLS